MCRQAVDWIIVEGANPFVRRKVVARV